MGVAAKLRKTSKVKGGEIVSRMLAAEGVDKVFGIIDGSYFGFYSTLPEQGIEIVTPRHETSGVHMAGAYARMSGRLGVCMASNGPGVANVLSGVAVENAEGNRVLLITSSRREGIVYPDRGGTFQYFPQAETIRTMCKWSRAVPSADRVAEIMRKAFRASFSGRPGLVHVDIPESVMNGAYDEDPSWFRPPASYRMHAPLEPSSASIEEAVRLLTEAERPLLHAGSGVIHAGAFDELRQVAERLHMPVSSSWAGRAVIDERHDLALPMVYVGAVNKARNEADLVLVLGSRLGETDWWGKEPYWAPDGEQQIIQVDLEPGELGKNRSVTLPIQADIGAFLRRLLDRLPALPDEQKSRRTWIRKLRRTCRDRRKQLDKKAAKSTMPMHSGLVPQVCREVFDDDAILVIDGGNTSVWGHFYSELRHPNTLMATFKMGHLGAGVAHALGAKAALPDRQVYVVAGDGAMGFNPQEVETAVRHALPVVYVVLCDRQWGMVKINQQFARKPLTTLVRGTLPPEDNINTDLCEIQFDQLARAMGAHGERVSDPAGLRGALRRAIASGRPAVVHVDVDPVAHLWAPELKTFKDMHLEPGA